MNDRNLNDLDLLIRDLWELRAWVERHPEVRGNVMTTTFYPTTTVAEESWRDLTPAEVASTVKVMLDLGTVAKRADDSYFTYEAKAKNGKARVLLIVGRNTVCEAKVVGQREVERPDPAAPKITVTEDIIEWECSPVLAHTEADLG